MNQYKTPKQGQCSVYTPLGQSDEAKKAQLAFLSMVRHVAIIPFPEHRETYVVISPKHIRALPTPPNQGHMQQYNG